MSLDGIHRSMRDSSLTIEDATGTPQDVTVETTTGDFTWTNAREYMQVSKRGVLDHVRPGNEVAVVFSCSAQWSVLYGSAASGPEELYEFVMIRSGLSIVSTAPSGWDTALTLVLVTTDPNGGTETATFNYCYFESVECAEADDGNTISLSGFDFETEPTIT